MAIFPGKPGLAGFIGAKKYGSGGANSSQIITNKPTPIFSQAGCPSCRPTNSVEALNGKQACYTKMKSCDSSSNNSSISRLCILWAQARTLHMFLDTVHPSLTRTTPVMFHQPPSSHSIVHSISNKLTVYWTCLNRLS